jgi:hypothetical protein
MKTLLLRPFWDPGVTATYLNALSKTIRRFGQIVVIKNKDEDQKLGIEDEENPLYREKSIVRKIKYLFSPRPNIEFIVATNDTWQKTVIKQIQSVDVVLVHLAPRASPVQTDFDDFAPSTTPRQSDDELLRELIHETGTGQGLLRELDYCRLANSLSKVIVLTPAHFYTRLQKALEIIEKYSHGTYWRKTASGPVALSPRLSALDQSLSVLYDAQFIIPYHTFDDRLFRLRLKSAMLQLSYGSKPIHSTSNVPVGVPNTPINLPPDDKKKLIRFSKIESLVKIPRGEIVELSFAEVVKIYPEIENENVLCPRCQRGESFMFWYQYGLEPILTKDKGTYMRCQYCGHHDYL